MPPTSNEKKTCRAPGCRRPAYAKGYCQPHYRRFMKGQRGRALEAPVLSHLRRASPTVKAWGLRLTVAAVKAVKREASARGLAPAALISQAVEAGAKKVRG